MKCKYCEKDHPKNHPHFKVVSRLSDKAFPTHEKKYPSAHEEADKQEKRKFGDKPYKKLQKVDSSLAKHELAGKNSKTGKIEVSEKVPKKLRNEVAFHEKAENKILRENERKRK